MSDEEKHVWEQLADEPSLWHGRFVKFLRLGAKRSLRAVFLRESKQKQAKASTNVGPGWCEAARKWQWEERARAYDEHVRAEEDRAIAEERDKVLRSGFALQHRRIKIYDQLLDQLIKATKEDEKVWIPDAKSIQTGLDSFERVDFTHLNAPLFAMIDKYLAAIAAEMGERVKKKEISGKDGGAIEYEIELIGKSPDEDGEGE